LLAVLALSVFADAFLLGTVLPGAVFCFANRSCTGCFDILASFLFDLVDLVLGFLFVPIHAVQHRPVSAAQ
jgi:hypothetical protein